MHFTPIQSRQQADTKRPLSIYKAHKKHVFEIWPWVFLQCRNLTFLLILPLFVFHSLFVCFCCLSDIERTKRAMHGSLQGLTNGLTFTVETKEDFNDNCLPTLDFNKGVSNKMLMNILFLRNPQQTACAFKLTQPSTKTTWLSPCS